MAIRLFAALITLCLAGCGFVSYEDVSDAPDFSKHVGAHYKTTSDMHVYRISMDQNYAPLPSVYSIVPPPGIDGPEVLSSAHLPEGSVMEVLAVKRCTDCYLDPKPRVHMVVRVTSSRQFDDFEVKVDQHVLSSHAQEVKTSDPRS